MQIGLSMGERMKLFEKVFLIFLCLSLCSCGKSAVDNNSSKYLAAIDQFEGFYEINSGYGLELLKVDLQRMILNF